MKLLPIVITSIATIAMTSGAFAQPTQTAQPQPPAAPAAPAASDTQKIQPMDESHRIQPEDIDKLLAEGKVLLLDVREPKELEEFGTIEDSINIPVGQLEKRLEELPKDRVILTA
jgi:Rhodanese-like domain